jgi:hypothetical protein
MRNNCGAGELAICESDTYKGLDRYDQGEITTYFLSLCHEFVKGSCFGHEIIANDVELLSSEWRSDATPQFATKRWGHE